MVPRLAASAAAARCRRRTRSMRCRVALGVHPAGQPAQPVDRRLLADPVGHVRVHRSRRSAQRLGQIVGVAARPSAVARRSHASAARTAVRSRNSRPTPPLTGVPACDQAHLHRGEQRVDPRRARRCRTGGVPAAMAAVTTLAPWCATGRRRRVDRAARSPWWTTRGSILATRRRLWRSSMSAAAHDVGRAAVVDLERVLAGAGEQLRRSRSASRGRRRCSRRWSGRRRPRRTPPRRGRPAGARAAGGRA